MVSIPSWNGSPLIQKKVEEARMIVNVIFSHVELSLKWEKHKLVGAGEI